MNCVLLYCVSNALVYDLLGSGVVYDCDVHAPCLGSR